MAYYDNGNWHITTMGQFLALLVDAGQDPAVLFRVVGDGQPNNDGEFARKMEVIVLPNGMVNSAIRNYNPETIHRILGELIEKGLVK